MDAVSVLGTRLDLRYSLVDKNSVTVECPLALKGAAGSLLELQELMREKQAAWLQWRAEGQVWELGVLSRWSLE